MNSTRSSLLGILVAAGMAAGSARAEADLLSRDTFSGVLDLRLAAADGETSWVDNGLGKARFGPRRRGLRLGEAALVWNPRFSDSVTAIVVAESQDGQDHVVDLGEAYLAYRGPGGGALRLSGRAGAFYPQISLEHDGLDWTVPDSITPSAVNSWVAEETKVAGVEATARGALLGQGVSATVGAFTHGDTSGTLLSFRGWALHDLKSPVTGRFPLPRLTPFMARRQGPATTPLREIDGATGYYARLEWRPVSKLTLDLFGYDNKGDRISVEDREWSWETRFWNLGARLDLGDTQTKAQVMHGETLMGYSNVNGVWIDAGFEAAYVSVTRALGPGGVTGGLYHFSVSDRTNKAVDNNSERGWSALAAYRWDVKPNTQVVFEALTVDSHRPDRARLGLSPDQRQTVLQTAYRRQF
jgi:hypothetical protein